MPPPLCVRILDNQYRFNYLIETDGWKTGKTLKVWSITWKDICRHKHHQRFPVRRQEVFRLTLASRKTVKATATHKFRTHRRLDTASVTWRGEYVAIPRSFLNPPGRFRMVGKAHLPDSYNNLLMMLNTGEDYLTFCIQHRIKNFPVPQPSWRTGDGSIKFPEAEAEPKFYTAPNRMFADDVSHLLLRLGIVAHVRKTRWDVR